MYIFGIIILSLWLLITTLVFCGVVASALTGDWNSGPLYFAAVLFAPTGVASIVWGVLKLVQAIN